MCRDFSAIVGWSKEHAVPGAESITKPEVPSFKEGKNELAALIESGKGWGLAGGH
jgi:hypothetical protein